MIRNMILVGLLGLFFTGVTAQTADNRKAVRKAERHTAPNRSVRPSTGSITTKRCRPSTNAFL